MGQKQQDLNSAELDTLVAMVEIGPLWDGDVPSKQGRDALIDRGLAVRVVVWGEDGFTAATYAGRDVYKRRYHGDTIAEAKAGRIAGRLIQHAKAAT